MPSRISDEFLEALQRTTDVHRLRWKAYLQPGDRENAAQINDYPVRFTDIDLFDHVNTTSTGALSRTTCPPSPRCLVNRCG